MHVLPGVLQKSERIDVLDLNQVRGRPVVLEAFICPKP